jgi:hypothetical protein
MAALVTAEEGALATAANAYKTLRKDWDDQVKAIATAKKTLAEKTAEYAALDAPTDEQTEAWEDEASAAGSKLNLEGAVATEEGKLTGKWAAYKKWLDEDYE